MKRSVYVSTAVWGEHRWPDAPARRMYLRHPHRHRFHVEHRVEVVHGDRDVEFHDLLDLVNEAIRMAALGDLGHGWLDFGTMSCEHIARAICEFVANAYPGRNLNQVCRVAEDGINGGEIEYP